MAIEFRDVAELEEITEIPEDADILVIVDGVAKRISKQNAKFGGGSVTTFYVTSSKKIYIDEAKTTEATPQQIYDAYMAGTVMLNTGTSGTKTLINGIIAFVYNGAPDNIVGVGIAYQDNGSGKLTSITVGDVGGN